MKKITFSRALKDGDSEKMTGYQGPPGLGVGKPQRDWYVYHLRSGATVYPFGFSSRKSALRFANVLATYADFTQDKDSIVAKHGKIQWANLTSEIARKVDADPTYGDPNYTPEDAPRPLPAVPIVGGFSIEGRTLCTALKGTSQAVKFMGVVVNPQILREVARLHPLLEIRPARGELRLATPNGRTRMRIYDGARVKHKDSGYSAEIRPVVRLAAAAD